VAVTPENADDPTIRAHFDVQAEAGALKSVAPVQPNPPSADPVPSAPSGGADEEDDGSNVRDSLKILCIQNGIDVKPRTTNACMRKALAARGINVN